MTGQSSKLVVEENRSEKFLNTLKETIGANGISIISMILGLYDYWQ